MWQIKRIVDLSHPLSNGLMVYPGDPVPYVSIATTIASHGYNLKAIFLGSQTGTHVDAPYHFRDDGATIDRMPLDLFIGPGVVVRVPGKAAREPITLKDLEPYRDRIRPGAIVLFNTNWYQKHGQTDFYDHPFLSPEAGEYLLSRGVRTVCVDAINIDPTGGTEFPIHEMWAAAGGIIGENMANFDKIEHPEPLIVMFPLNLVGADGAPVRAVALEF